MGLKLEEVLPFLLRQSLCLLAEQQLDHDADCIWENFRVQSVEDLAFEAVVGLP